MPLTGPRTAPALGLRADDNVAFIVPQATPERRPTMFFSSWLRNRKSSRGPRCQGPRFRPRLEALEDRWLPSTLTVTSPLDNGSSGTLRATIAAAASGDTIVFANSLNGQTITLNGNDLLINKNLTIQGLGANQLAISGNHLSRVFEVAVVPGTTTAPQVSLSGLTIRDGNAPGTFAPYCEGGGIFNGGTLMVNNCTLSGNSADAGGGIANSFLGSLTVTGSTIGVYGSGNFAAAGGGIYNESSNTTKVSGGTLSYNSAGRDGGGIFNGGFLTVTGCTLSHNSAVGDGGGLYDNSGRNPQIQTTTLFDNSAGSNGGGIYNLYTMSLSGCTVGVVGHGNSAVSAGGGIFNAGTLSVSSGPLSNNVATISGNSGANGGGVYNIGTLAVNGCTFSGNSARGIVISPGVVAGGMGGGLFNAGYVGAVTIAPAMINNTYVPTTFSKNSALTGGAIYNDPYNGYSMTVSGCTISGNSANVGGGIYNADVFKASLTMTDSTITSNTATSKGGGIYNAGTASLQNTKVSNNSAGAQGGGIFNDTSGALTLYSSSIVSGNLAPEGDDIDNFGHIFQKKG
jgi:hypothetical protein